MDELEQIKALVGKEVTAEQLKDVDCYVHGKIGLFIPSRGPCQYAAKPNHTHPSYMFVLFVDEEKEQLDIKLKGSQYLVVATSPDIPHNDSEMQFYYYCILIEKGYFEEQYKLYSQNIPCLDQTSFMVCHDMLKTLNTFIFEVTKRMSNADITLAAQTTLITHWLIRSLLGENYDMRPIATHYAVARAQHYIEQHFNEGITVGGLAQLGNMSVSNFNRIFKKEMHITPIEYLIHARVEQAKKFLRRGELSITEIALRCGFSSSAHFSSKFNKEVGVTPSEYRQAYIMKR